MANTTDDVPEVLAGLCVPAGTFNPDTEDPRHPHISKQRSHALGMAARVAEAYGIDLETYEPGVTPLPQQLIIDLRDALERADGLVADYVASRPRRLKPGAEEIGEGEPCHAESNAA